MVSKPTIRVSMVSHGYYPVIGGAEEQIRSLVPHLQREQIDLSVITRQFSGLERRESIDGVDVLRIPIPPPKPIASLSFTALGVDEIVEGHFALQAGRTEGIPLLADEGELWRLPQYG